MDFVSGPFFGKVHWMGAWEARLGFCKQLSFMNCLKKLHSSLAHGAAGCNFSGHRRGPFHITVDTSSQPNNHSSTSTQRKGTASKALATIYTSQGYGLNSLTGRLLRSSRLTVAVDTPETTQKYSGSRFLHSSLLSPNSFTRLTQCRRS